MLHAPAPCSLFHVPCSLLLHAHVPCRAPCSAPCSAPCFCSCPVHTPSGAACQPSACAAPPPALPPRQGKPVDSSAAPSVDDRLLVPIAEVTCGSQPSMTSNTHCHPGTRPSQGGPRPALLWVPIQPFLANEGHLLGTLWQRRQDSYSVRPTKTQLVSIAAVRQTSALPLANCECATPPGPVTYILSLPMSRLYEHHRSTSSQSTILASGAHHLGTW
jgi:hypothetical protein